MSAFVGFRLNVTKDADILKDLEKYTDTTARVKEAYRKAIMLEKGLIAPTVTIVAPAVREVAPTAQVKKTATVWNFPSEPTVKYPLEADKLKANILSNGF